MKKSNFVQELRELAKNNLFYSSIIISNKNQEMMEEIADEIIRFMVCINQSSKNDDCIFCKRSLKHTLNDAFYLGDGINQISKEEIKLVVDKLMLSALEIHGKKFYIIKNAENLKISAANALLKFLEEPPANTYAILLSKDRTMILPTIKSRCKLFVIEDEIDYNEKNEFEVILETRNKEVYLLASTKFKKKDKTEFIRDLEDAYHRTIINQFPDFSEDTLILIDDLKSIINDKLAIDNYFIKIAERV